MTNVTLDIADTLRQLVLAEPSVLHVARATGIPQATLQEFASGRSNGTFPDIRLSAVQRLFDYFGPERLGAANSPSLPRRKQRMRLATELRGIGWNDSPQKFKERLIDRLMESFPETTIDDLLTQPDDARRFCDLIRHESENSQLSDPLILKALVNIRKRKDCPTSLKSVRCRTNWQQLLKEYGIVLDIELFYETLVDCLAGMYKESTIDGMLCHPIETKKYCDYVRQRLSYSKISDQHLLRALMNYRKTSRNQ